jgi:hypothetical protein
MEGMYMRNQVIWTKIIHIMLISLQKWHFVDDFDYVKLWRFHRQ